MEEKRYIVKVPLKYFTKYKDKWGEVWNITIGYVSLPAHKDGLITIPDFVMEDLRQKGVPFKIIKVLD